MLHIIPTNSGRELTAIEFFAGIGLARAGMNEAGIRTIWANDWDARKREMYSQQWGDDDLFFGDVFDVNPELLPSADVAWSSSPCTDLSLAGKRDGIRGHESSAFFGFVEALKGLGERVPPVVVLENVVGLASSHSGEDLRAAIQEFNKLGYSVDVITIDARRFIPQSRPRLFVLGALEPVDGGREDSTLRPDWLSWVHKDPDLKTFMFPFPAVPDALAGGFTGLTEDMDESDTRWWDDERVDKFVNSMSVVQRGRLEYLRSRPDVSARTAYRRTRNGKPTWEMRADDIAGCLRTARGGSSKQAVVIAGQGKIQIRWMTGLEYARLMGAGWYKLGGLRDSQIQYGFGDAVAVPAVSWLSRVALAPLALNAGKADRLGIAQ